MKSKIHLSSAARILSVFLLSLLLVAGGCKSSRKTARRPYGTERPKTSSTTRLSTPGTDEKRRIVNATPDALVREAEKWLGTPYRYGGSERGKGTDCSGLTMEVYRKVTGLKIPRNSAAQQEFCIPMKRDKLESGDLVFFSSKKGGGRVSHVGLYVNEGVFIHASTSRGVIASHLDENYYSTHYHSSGRVPGFKRSGKDGSGKTKKNATKEKREKVRPEQSASPTERPERPAPVNVAVPAHHEPAAPALEPDTLVREIELPRALPEPDTIPAGTVQMHEPPRIEAETPVAAPASELADSIAARVRMAF